MRLFGRGKGRITFSLEKTVDHTRAVCRGQINRETFLAKSVLNLDIDGLKINLWIINMIDDDHPALVLIFCPAHHSPTGALDALLGIDDDRHSFDGWQNAERSSDKIRIARGI